MQEVNATPTHSDSGSKKGAVTVDNQDYEELLDYKGDSLAAG